MSHSSEVYGRCWRLLAVSCDSRLVLPSPAHRATKGQASQDAQPLIHSVINPPLRTRAKERHGVLWGWAAGEFLGCIWVNDSAPTNGILHPPLERRQAICAHVEPAQGGAVEQVKGQRGPLEPQYPGGDPDHKPAAIHGALSKGLHRVPVTQCRRGPALPGLNWAA